MDFKLLKEKGGKNEVQLNIRLIKKKRNCKNQNGITLIALVVTIVVLLILAGVSVNALFGNSGIIEKAKEAQKKVNESVQNDTDQINQLSQKLDEILYPPFEKYENETLYYNNVAFDGYLIYLTVSNTFNLKQSQKDSNLYYCLKDNFTGDITKAENGVVVSIYKNGKTFMGLNLFEDKMYFNNKLFSGAYFKDFTSTGVLDIKYSMGKCCYGDSNSNDTYRLEESNINNDGYYTTTGYGIRNFSGSNHYLEAMITNADTAYYIENGTPYTGTFCSYSGNGTATNGISQDTFLLAYCLTSNTEIYIIEEDEKKKKKRIKKKIKDVKVGDKVVSINPITGEEEEDIVIFADGSENKKYKEYDIWKFEDGTVIETVKRHRFYNVQQQDFKYMDEWNIGDYGYNYNGEKIKLIGHEKVEKEVQHCTIFTEKWNNYFANGMLSGNRNSSKIKL